MLRGVMDYAASQQLHWNIVPSPDRNIESDARRIQQARPPAVIIGRSNPEGAVRHARSHGVKWVDWAYDGSPGKGDAAVSFDPVSIGHAAADYLHRAGRMGSGAAASFHRAGDHLRAVPRHARLRYVIDQRLAAVDGAAVTVRPAPVRPGVGDGSGFRRRGGSGAAGEREEGPHLRPGP